VIVLLLRSMPPKEYAVNQSPLRAFHERFGAHLVEYAGWEMPLRYGSVQDEAKQVRTNGGLFDVSHMGRVWFKGRHARRLVGRLCTRRVSDMKQGQCRYTLICNERGGVRDDALIYRLDDDEFMLVVNAANREKLLDHFASVKAEDEYKVEIDDRTLKTAMLAFQGPKVMDMISRVSSEVPTLKRYRFTVKNLLVFKLIVSRTGYTGEDGVEVVLPSGMVDTALKLLLKDIDMAAEGADIRPIGLAARDTLRLEAGMALYGHELGEDIDALGCNVGFAINLDKDEGDRPEPFVGQEALKRSRDAGGPARTLVGLVLDGKRTPRQGMTVLAGDTAVGAVSSGCLSPTLDRPIAMAFVERESTEPGTALAVDAGRAKLDAEVVPLPFYTRPKQP